MRQLGPWILMPICTAVAAYRGYRRAAVGFQDVGLSRQISSYFLSGPFGLLKNILRRSSLSFGST